MINKREQSRNSIMKSSKRIIQNIRPVPLFLSSFISNIFLKSGFYFCLYLNSFTPYIILISKRYKIRYCSTQMMPNLEPLSFDKCLEAVDISPPLLFYHLHLHSPTKTETFPKVNYSSGFIFQIGGTTLSFLRCFTTAILCLLNTNSKTYHGI